MRAEKLIGRVPSFEEGLSQTAAMVSFPSGLLPTDAGMPMSGLAGVSVKRCHSSLSQRAPSVAPSSAPRSTRLDVLQAPESLRFSRNALAAAMSLTRMG